MELRLCGVLQDVKSGQLDSVVRELLQRTGAQRIGVHTGPLQQGQIYSGGMPIRLCVSVYVSATSPAPPPSSWNSLPDNLRNPTLLQPTLIACWKRFCFQHSGAISALDVLQRCALQIYILHTYFYLLFATPLLSLDYGPPLLILAQTHIQKTTNLFYLRSP